METAKRPTVLDEIDEVRGPGVRFYLFIRVMAAILFLAFSGSRIAQAQDYLTQGGAPTFAAPEPIELGFTDASNGNLHLEIPFGSFPQRGSGTPLTINEVYNSSLVWTVACGGSGCSWGPANTTDYSGWQFMASTGSWMWSVFECPGTINFCGYVFTGPGGTSRTFFFTSTPCPGLNVYASDSSGYMLEPCGANGWPAVYAPDGTLVYEGDDASILAKDTNGNYITESSNNVSDTLGRPVDTLTTCTGGGSCYQVTNSQGQTSTYKVTTATIAVKTNFGQSGVTEFSGNLAVVQSITLPDGTSYTFKYDCDSSTNSACGSPSGQSAYYGLLTSMTLPTGGTITYGYTTFSDSYSNKAQWLTSRTSQSGTWTYTPQVISTCSSSQVGCQAKVTVDTPNGGSTIYTFTLNNGAWPVEVQSYSGGNLVSTVTNTYDTSNACLYSGCHGAAYIRLTNTQTTLTVPSGSITKQTTYGYDSPQTGNITELEEWGYYPGASPTFPSTPNQATFTTYATIGTNDIDRPSNRYVCDYLGSGCTKDSQTLYTYDSYSGSCPGGGLATVSGTSNHDDTNFGSNYTTRGNPTQVEQWVSGSTYLTTTYCYDTTGQVTEKIDPAGNSAGYGYADNFYTDPGSGSPTPYTPNQATNAYLTSVTLPIIGTEHLGYYYGSGNQALLTDQNGATTYYHSADPFSRPTETVFPIGWNLETYPSATESDSYSAVADTSPSAGCSSCRHYQTFLDSLGRQTEQTLANNPMGAVNVSDSYGLGGVLADESHAYTSPSDPNYVFEIYAYDGVNRPTRTTHPDSEYSQIFYGAAVAQDGGLSSQQGSPSTYGYGYPELMVDEEGKQKQEWIDAFGHVIEVDEPETIATPGEGSVGISGQEQFIEICEPNCHYTYDSGTVTITVNGHGDSTSYGGYSTPDTIASALATAINNDSNAPETALASGSGITLTSKATGLGTNYSLSASTTYNSRLFSGPSFDTSTSGSNFTGGNNAGSSLASPTVALYQYDALGDLTSVVQGTQTRTFAYDGLGRKTSESTPESGSISYSYAGCSGDPSNLCSMTDARGISKTYAYDSLNRMTSKSYSNGQGSVTYSYDQGGASGFALGRLTEMADPSGSETYTYDADGDILQLQKVIGTTTYTLGYQYNAGGELTQVTYPSGRVVNYSYNAIGQLCDVAPSAGCTASSSYASAYSYDPSGDVTGFTYGNGLFASYNFAPKTEQLSCLDYSTTNRQGTCTHDSTTKFGLSYYYQVDPTNCPNGTADDDGPIDCITDSVNSGRTVSYTYDALKRLNSAETSGSTDYPQWGLAETYDQWNNRLSQSVTAGSGPSSSLTFNGNNQPTGSGYGYDASGDMSYDPATLNNYAYDDDNRLTTVTGGATAGYTYDGNGLRVQKSVSGTTTVYIYSGSKDIAEYDNGAAPSSPSREFIYGNGQLLAEVSGSTTTYYQSDHLSVRMTTDSSGNVLGQQGHYPFGESWYSSRSNQSV
jgi:YD repeat-containing protein